MSQPFVAFNPHLDYNAVIQLMRDFGAESINKHDEVIFDYQYNIYASIRHCKSYEDVQATFFYAHCRPIGKQYADTFGPGMLKTTINPLFRSNLTVQDMRVIYRELCYPEKLENMKRFIQDDFPMDRISDYA